MGRREDPAHQAALPRIAAEPLGCCTAEPLLGDGLFLAEGENWKRLHRMSIQAFQPARIRAYADDMAQCAEDLVASWRHGDVRDIYRDTTHLTVRVGARTLFGADGSGEAEKAKVKLAEAFDAFDAYLSSRFPLPLSLPTPSGVRMRRASRELDSISHSFIRQRRESGEQRADLLSMLLRARDEDGSAFTERELRDVAWNIFGTGFDTTALTLAWSIFLLARHPEVAHRLRAEIAEVVGADRVGADHLPHLTLGHKPSYMIADGPRLGDHSTTQRRSGKPGGCKNNGALSVRPVRSYYPYGVSIGSRDR
jgi:cytochrome P450